MAIRSFLKKRRRYGTTGSSVWNIRLVDKSNCDFYLIRFSTRANEQVEALKEINKKQDAQIDLLIQVAHKRKDSL